jgi:hypothetical protein
MVVLLALLAADALLAAFIWAVSRQPVPIAVKVAAWEIEDRRLL